MSNENSDEVLVQDNVLDDTLVGMGFSGTDKVIAAYELEGKGEHGPFRIEIVREVGADSYAYESRVYEMAEIRHDKEGGFRVWRVRDRGELSKPCRTPEEALRITISLMETRKWLKRRPEEK